MCDSMEARNLSKGQSIIEAMFIILRENGHRFKTDEWQFITDYAKISHVDTAK